MNQACKAFRVEWLGGEAGSMHASECPACALWTDSSRRMVAVLARLERMPAPAELEARLALELAGDRSRRLQRVLNSFVRRGAPAALDERLSDFLGVDEVSGDERRGPPKAEVLRSLDVHSAPDVLERLLSEELEAPERQRVERFSGTLERMRAPAALADRIGSVVRRRALGRLVLGPLATLAAAGLVLWIAVRQGEPEPRRYRFEVIQAASLEGLDPLARALAESLNGGASPPGGVR